MAIRCDIFCNVVDNFGDIGVAWRLARQLSAEHGFAVRLWVDELQTFRRIWPGISADARIQLVEGIEVHAWREPFIPVPPAQVVIESFGCALPEAYVRAMATAPAAPLWINLEYLSAEDWVAGHHGLPSPHPRLPLTKYFFFPGYAPGTGGLLRERELIECRDRFRQRERGDFLRRLRVDLDPGERCLSLFAYENRAVGGLLDACSAWDSGVVCLVPEGRVLPEVARWLGRPILAAGERWRRGRLTLQVLPFLDQEDYDRLLWASDINFVRGEDSCVRAQWAARPMVWQAYPQADDAHWNKVEALLGRYAEGLPGPAADVLGRIWRVWNGVAETPDAMRLWGDFLGQAEALAGNADAWCEALRSLGDLAGNLVDFIENHL